MIGYLVLSDTSYHSIYKALVDGLDEYSDLLDSYSSSETKNKKMNHETNRYDR